jgi:surface antigen
MLYVSARRYHALWLVAALAMCIGWSSTNAQAAHDIALRSVSRGAESHVVNAVRVHSFSRGRCTARVRKGHRRRWLPSAGLPKSGAVEWAWEPSRGVSSGRWRVRVSCKNRTGRRHASKRTSFLAPPGTGPGRASRLFADRRVRITPLRSGCCGSGGGTTHDLYPRGQCTWWVKQLRQDIPYFPGRAGDAANWATSAEQAHFPVGDIPVKGAIAVWRSEQYNVGRYGHVAVVLDVKDDQIKVSEMNWGGDQRPAERWHPWHDLRFIYGGIAGHGPSEPTAVQITSPASDASVAGTLHITATSDAPGVIFTVFFYSDPSSSSSGHTTQVRDDTPPDGFSADVDSTTIPNQGGPAGSSVVITARPLRPGGSLSDLKSSVRVNVANTRVVNGVTIYPYYVVSACGATPSCLNLRSGPGRDGYSIVGSKHDGDEADVFCQARGQAVDNPDGSTSDVWDQLIDGSWALDYYLDTPNHDFSPPIPQCAAPHREAVVHYDCPNQAGAVAVNLNPGQYWRNDFVATGDQITDGTMYLTAPNDGSQHQATVGIYRDATASDAVGSKTVAVPVGGSGVSVTFDAPLGVSSGATYYYAVRAIDAVTVYDEPGADGCVIGHLNGTQLVYDQPH